MELGAFSPDIDARLSYLLLLLGGMLAAFREVGTRLKSLPGIWSEWRTHVLFAFFWLSPLVLFFLFDHAGALNDSSPIAALLIAFGYQQILSRGSGTPEPGIPAAPPQIGGLWQNILGDTNKLQERAQDDHFHRQFNYGQATRRMIAGDAQRYDALRALTRRLTNDIPALDAKLAAIDAALVADPVLAVWNKTDALLGELEAVYVRRGMSSRVNVLLQSEGIINAATRDLYPADGRADSWQRAATVLVPAILAFALVAASFANCASLGDAWYHWRLVKPHATGGDLGRTREALIGALAASTDQAKVVGEIARLMRDESLTPARVDVIIGVLVHDRRSDPKVNARVWSEMMAGLRLSNVDSRARVNSALVYLAKARLARLEARAAESAGAPADSEAARRKDADTATLKEATDILKGLADWKPSESDSVTDLAQRIDDWRTFERMTAD